MLLTATVSVVALASAQAQVAALPVYDVVIRHGKVLDGAGNPWIAADVAILNGRFVKIGKVEGTGRREIDATGLYVSPGWIDVMDQSADVLLKNGLADNKLREGVTTAIAGEGGTPVDADHIEEYFAKLKQQGISMNFGCYYSEAQARVAVIGEVDRPPTPEELAKMKGLMATAMQQGAMGMTTALIYPPSSYAKTDELIAMAKVAGAYGGL
jgi:N-acyl-D-aspartate/D-glutamate deacylase